jgi:RNA polymerase sigma factor (sigma-70 family)
LKFIDDPFHSWWGFIPPPNQKELSMDFKKYENMIRKIAWGLSHNQYEFDELMSIGKIKFFECIQEYDPEVSELSTFVWVCCRNQMIIELNKLRRERNMLSIEEEGFTEPTSFDPEERHQFLAELFSTLSQESQEVVSMVLKSPEEIFSLSESMKPKMLRGALVQVLREKDWSWPKIWSSFREIKSVIGNI